MLLKVCLSPSPTEAVIPKPAAFLLPPITNQRLELPPTLGWCGMWKRSVKPGIGDSLSFSLSWHILELGLLTNSTLRPQEQKKYTLIWPAFYGISMLWKLGSKPEKVFSWKVSRLLSIKSSKALFIVLGQWKLPSLCQEPPQLRILLTSGWDEGKATCES